MLRCAEVAGRAGFNYFIIVEADQYSKKGLYKTPSTSYTSATVSGNSGSATTTTYGGQIYTISKPRALNTIVCFKEKPEMNTLVYGTQFLIDSIKNKYNIQWDSF